MPEKMSNNASSGQRTNKSTVNSTKRKTTTTKKRRKRKMKKHSTLLWVGIAVAIIPCVLIGYILFSAIVDTGKPIFGKRFENDLNPAITEEQINSIEYNVKLIENVENVSASLTASTLRLIVDMNDALTVEDATTMGAKASEILNEVLPLDTYFTQYGTKKMYDFEIYVVDKRPSDTVSPSINVLVHKSGGMEKAETRVLSESVNPEFVEQLEAEQRAEEEAANTTAPSGEEEPIASE